MSKEADMYILPPVCIIIMSEILMENLKLKVSNQNKICSA